MKTKLTDKELLIITVIMQGLLGEVNEAINLKDKLDEIEGRTAILSSAKNKLLLQVEERKLKIETLFEP